MLQRFQHGHVLATRVVRFLGRQLGLQGLAFLRGEPLGLTGLVSEQPENRDSENDGRQRPHEIDPLPACHAKDGGMIDSRAFDDLLRAQLHPLGNGLSNWRIRRRKHDHAVDLVRANVQEQVRDLRIDHLGHRCRDEEIGQSLCAVTHGEPMGEIDDDTGEETSLGQAQQKAHRVELKRRGDESRERSHESPAHHDAADPLPGAPALDHQRAGNFQ